MSRNHSFAEPFRPGLGVARGIARAFTIMELMVAIAILVILILAVAVIFNGASRSVSSSTALMETLSNVRAVQQQIDRLVAGIDRNGFLVIRSQMLYTNTTGTPPNAATSPRFDQVAFLSYGTFPNRTGASTNTPFVDGTTSNAAHVWIGHLVLEQNRTPPVNPSYTSSNQEDPVKLEAWPTGVSVNPAGTIDSQCTLGIHTTLLLPGVASTANELQVNGQPVKAYNNLLHDLVDPSVFVMVDGKKAHITSSRVAVAALTPGQLISLIEQAGDYSRVCYRFKALESVYETELQQSAAAFVNGYYRTHPIAMRGVSSFKVDWQDGSGNWHWFGNPAGVPGLDRTFATRDTATNDSYQAAFTQRNSSLWPQALRFSYHLVDPNDRLQGGRDFTQIVRLGN